MGGSGTSPWLANPQLSPSEQLFPNTGMAKKEKIQKSSLLPEQHRDINGHIEGFFLPTRAFWPRCLGRRLVAHAAVSLQWHARWLAFLPSSGCHIGEKL